MSHAPYTNFFFHAHYTKVFCFGVVCPPHLPICCIRALLKWLYVKMAVWLSMSILCMVYGERGSPPSKTNSSSSVNQSEIFGCACGVEPHAPPAPLPTPIQAEVWDLMSPGFPAMAPRLDKSSQLSISWAHHPRAQVIMVDEGSRSSPVSPIGPCHQRDGTHSIPSVSYQRKQPTDCHPIVLLPYGGGGGGG